MATFKKWIHRSKYFRKINGSQCYEWSVSYIRRYWWLPKCDGCK